MLMTGALLAWLTWNISGDILVDAGRDPYTAQQINAGRRLFTDVSYLYGPLPPYILAWGFTLFGESLNVARSCNLAILILVVAMIYRVLKRLSDPALAAIGCCIFLILFGFGQLTALRNYNFLLPYTGAATTGFALCITALFTVFQMSRSEPNRWTFGAWSATAGAAAGLNFLVKPEFFLAGAITLFAGLAALPFALRIRRKTAMLSIGIAVAAFAIAPAAVLLLISVRVPWHDLWEGTIIGYRLAGDSRVTSMPLFRDGLGLASIRKTLPPSLLWCCQYVAILFPALLVSLYAPRLRQSVLASILILLLYCIAPIVLIPDTLLAKVANGMPFLLITVLISASYALLRHRNPPSFERWIFCIFCLAMLLRMLMNARLYHYGFVSASPALMLVLMAGGCWLPQVIAQRGGAVLPIRFATIGLLLGILWMHWQKEWRIIQAQSIALPGGLSSSGDKGRVLQQALHELSLRAKPGDTLAVWPEGAGINFVTKLPNPTPFELVNPLGIIRAGGEEVVADAYRRNPPTWIMLAQINTSETGLHPFGVAYARPLLEMLHGDYQVEVVVGPHPFTTPMFGVAIYKLRPVPTTAPATLP